MKNPRWRAIIKSGEKICPRLMEKYYWSENVQMQWANGGMGVKEEMRVLETLHSYANIICRTSKIEMYAHPQEWVQELTNFTD